MSIELVMPSNHLLCHPLLLLPTIFPSIRVFSSESVLHIRWQKYRSFSFSPFNEYLGLIFFRNDWFDLLAVQGTLKSLLQHHKWNESESRSVVSDSLQLHGLQHARPSCPSLSPGVHSNSCSLNWWCHPTISSFVIPFSSRPQSFPASGSFQWVGSSHQLAKVLERQLQHQFFQWIFKVDFL